MTPRPFLRMGLLVLALSGAGVPSASMHQPDAAPRIRTESQTPARGGGAPDGTREAESDPWRRASPSRTVRVPDDHVAHPEYRLEWWYYTGNLQGDDGRAYGYQVTFFRVGVNAAPTNPSVFTVRDLYMTHVALTDVSGRQHRYADRLNRAGVNWAGARTDRYEVWNENWRASLDAAGRHRVAADTGTFALDLTLEPGKPPVLQGERGYSRKGSDPGNASHYYSLTRMPTSGTIRIGDRVAEVTGASWMDHEFGTSALEPGTRGWDWFALQFDDGRELMVYRLRLDNGRARPLSAGTLVECDGSATHLSADEFALVPRRTWTSPASGASYPVQWDLRIPAAGIELSIAAAVDAQELRTRQSTNVTYWEGSVRLEGTARGTPVRGVGYLEMTGYSGARMSDVMR